jgi:MFS transporter, FHS family, glucose/mannose:H+ symporter
VTNERRLTGLAYACLLIVGIHAGWMGPFLPEIARVVHLSIDRAGLIISATFTGYFVALICAGALSHRWSAQTILISAMVLFAAGMCGLAAAPRLPMLLCAGGLIGLGNGAIDVAANALVVDLNRDRLAAALNYLHVLFGIGALIGPVIVAFALARTIPYWWIFGFGAVACALVAVALVSSPAIEVRVAPEAGGGFIPLLARPLIWVIGGVLFLYVGGETGIGTWLFLYLRTAARLGATIASSGVSLYWLGLIAGRIIGGRLAHRIGPRELTMLAGTVSALALVGLIAAPTWHGLAAAMVFLIGFGYGPVFPNMIAVGAARFPSQVGRMSSIVIAGGALGGVFVPWIMGRAMAVATPRSSMEYAVGVTVLMALLSVAVRGAEEPIV